MCNRSYFILILKSCGVFSPVFKVGVLNQNNYLISWLDGNALQGWAMNKAWTPTLTWLNLWRFPLSCSNLLFILIFYISKIVSDAKISQDLLKLTTLLRYAGITWLLFLVRHLYLSGVWLGVDVRKNDQKDVFKWDWTTSSKYFNHFRLNSQHNWEGPIWPFNELKNLHFDNE